MKVTISDVARLAGVSTATVSHTINGTRYVSGDTKDRVYRAIAELGYTPDASARSFRTGKRKTVGFIVPDISNRFFGTMIEATENFLTAQGYSLIIANTKENMDREERNIRLLTAGLVDGLLVASTMDDFALLDELIPPGFPVVLVDRNFREKKYACACVSSFQSIYRSVCRLAGKGFRRVGLMAGLPRLSTTRDRVAAYRKAVEDCGLAKDEALVQYGDSMEESAPLCLDRLLELHCDAIVICQGMMAAVSIAHLRRLGIRPRQDLEVVCFVDYNIRSYDFYYDDVDCIVQPVEQLGLAAGELILQRIEKPEAAPMEKILTAAYQPCGADRLDAPPAPGRPQGPGGKS